MGTAKTETASTTQALSSRGCEKRITTEISCPGSSDAPLFSVTLHRPEKNEETVRRKMASHQHQRRNNQSAEISHVCFPFCPDAKTKAPAARPPNNRGCVKQAEQRPQKGKCLLPINNDTKSKEIQVRTSDNKQPQISDGKMSGCGPTIFPSSCYAFLPASFKTQAAANRSAQLQQDGKIRIPTPHVSIVAPTAKAVNSPSDMAETGKPATA